MNIDSHSALNKTLEVSPEVMQMLCGLLEREVTTDNQEK